MLKAGALFYSLVIAFIIAIMCSSLILFTYYINYHYLYIERVIDVDNNASSGINLLLSDYDYGSFKDSLIVDLYGQGTDSVILKRRPWGLFEVISSHAFRKDYSSTLSAIVGYEYKPNDLPALYLCDLSTPLSLCGNTVLRGDCFLPKSGIRRAYIEGQTFVGKELIDGRIYQSDNRLPDLISSLKNGIYELLEYGKNENHELELTNGAINNSFKLQPFFYRSQNSITVSGIDITGNVIIRSERGIIVESSANLKDVVLIAPFVLLKKGVRSTAQYFATDSLVVEDQCELSYPSVLGLIKYNYVNKPYIKIGRNCKISGVIFSTQQNALEDDKSILMIDENSEFEGIIYSPGSLELNGVVHGSVFTSKLFLRTNSAFYENHLLNAEINRKKLSENFFGIPIMNNTSNKGIIEWIPN
jgi:cytoskeletal protein CcmA (bactofilin family)